jgi:hypothetical protein
MKRKTQNMTNEQKPMEKIRRRVSLKALSLLVKSPPEKIRTFARYKSGPLVFYIDKGEYRVELSGHDEINIDGRRQPALYNLTVSKNISHDDADDFLTASPTNVLRRAYYAVAKKMERYQIRLVKEARQRKLTEMLEGL